MSVVPQYEPLVRPKYARAVYRQIMTGNIGCCGRVKELEETLADLTGAKHVLATTSGTSALMLSLWALRLDPGTKILFPNYTFIAGANAATVLGYKVVLVDVREETLCMNPEHVKTLLSAGDIGAVLFVNHNGYMGGDVRKVRALCDEYRVPMIEDSSQALFVNRAGRTGDAGVFSFSVPKIVTGGQGGVMLTDDDRVAEIASQYRDQGGGWRESRYHRNIGVNLKYNDIQAAYIMAQLKDRGFLCSTKKALLDRYRNHINLVDFGQPLVAFAIYRTRKAAALQAALYQHDYESVMYYRPISHNPPFSTPREFPVSLRMYEELLYLPSSLTLGMRQIDEICSVINRVEDK